MLSAALLSMPTAILLAQQTTVPPTPAPGEITVSINVSAFTPLDTATIYSLDAATFARYGQGGGGSGTFAANLSLPSGAGLDQVAFEFYANNSASVGTGSVWRCSENPAGGSCFDLGSVSPTGAPGWVYVTVGPLSETLDNLNNSYFLYTFLPADGNQTEFRRAVVYYHLQVSPSPATATFNDVPTTHPFFQFIEALHASGITGGCQASPPLYCPDDPLTRGQMAVFLAKALGLYWPN
jgi:hypothetical protein